MIGTMGRNRKRKKPMLPAELKKLRAALGLSQNELAELLDCSRHTILDYEGGKTAIPGPFAMAVRLYVQVSGTNSE
jgi:transcriptional regulator with XRE-family HTH domain